MKEIGSDFEYIEIQKDYKFFTLPVKGIKTEYLRSGREAIRYCLKLLKGKLHTAFLPAYTCRSVVLPFIEEGIEIKYYDIDEKLRPVLSEITDFENSIFLYINYFGRTIISKEHILKIKSATNNCYIIKDSTQDYFDNNVDEDVVDFEICSIRKWIPIPEGAVVHIFNRALCNREIELVNDSSWSESRENAMRLKAEYILSGNAIIKKRYREEFSKLNSALYENNDIVKMTDKSKEYYAFYNKEQMRIRRKENAITLYENLFNKLDVSLFVAGECPLYFPIIVSERDEMQKYLAQNGIYCPVIWPIPEEAKNISQYGEYIAANMLALPCDQRYTVKDMYYVIKIIGEKR